MMYSEFVCGTGCKDNAHNYKVYQDLEIMYMNSDLTKDAIYEYGKKLVDNSKSVEEIELENRIKAEIEDQKQYIAHCKSELEYYESMFEVSKESGNDVLADMNKGSIKYYRQEIKEARSKISALKWVLG